MQTGTTCKKIPFLTRNELADGVLIKLLKYSEVMLKSFYLTSSKKMSGHFIFLAWDNKLKLVPASFSCVLEFLSKK